MICLLVAAVVWTPVTFSVYSEGLHGERMSNGKPYDKHKMTVASNVSPLGSSIVIASGGIQCTVKVTDRMAKRFTGKRIDLSSAAWRHLSRGRKPGLLRGKWRLSK